MTTQLIIIKKLTDVDCCKVTIKSGVPLLEKEQELSKLLKYGREIAKTWAIYRAVLFLNNTLTHYSELHIYLRGNIDNALSEIGEMIENLEKAAEQCACRRPQGAAGKIGC